MKVDICSIMYNEELLLPYWIESWLSLPFINKIYLVDGGSIDRSFQVAKDYDRVKVVKIPRKNDFSRQRNLALKLSTSDIKWVIQPDIDEMPCGDFDSLHKLTRLLNSVEFNQLIIPYIKFYDWDTLWFFKKNVPTMVTDKVVYAVNKSTTTIFKKDHLRGYSKKLHEMPVYSIISLGSFLNKYSAYSISSHDNPCELPRYDRPQWITTTVRIEPARSNRSTIFQ